MVNFKFFISRLCVLVAILFFSFISMSSGQPISQYTFSQTSTVYNSITGGTSLFAGIIDYQVANNIPIGFTFVYGGQNYSSVSIAADGYLTLDSALQGSNTVLNSAMKRVISAFCTDLRSDTSASLSYLTSGTAPNRVFTTQWKNFKKYNTNTYVFSFQIKLYESSNEIEFVYGPSYQSGLVNYDVGVGLIGQDSQNFSIRSVTAGVNNWDSSVASALLGNKSKISTLNSVYPAQGLLYKWAPPAIAPLNLGLQTLPGLNSNNCNALIVDLPARIKNTGSLTWDFALHPANVQLFASGSSSLTSPASLLIDTGTLAPGATMDLVVCQITPANGQTLLRGVIQSADDTVHYDDSLNLGFNPAFIQFNNSIYTGSFPYYVNFSAIPSPPILIEQVALNGNWTIETSGNLSMPNTVPTNPGFARFLSYYYATSTSSRLLLPVFDFSGMSQPSIRFRMNRSSNFNNALNEGVHVVVSTDGGLTWSNSLYFAQRYIQALIPVSTGTWYDFNVNLCAYAGNVCVRIGLVAVSGFGDNIAIDELSVYDAQNCLSYSQPYDCHIAGKAFIDYNSNGVMDTLEPSLGNVALNAVNGSNNFSTTINYYGYYLHTVPGTTNVTVGSLSYYNCSLSNFSVYLDSLNPDTIINIPFVPIPGIQDVSLDLQLMMPFKQGFYGGVKIVLNNTGTIASSGTIVLKFNSALALDSSSYPYPAGQTADSVYFNYTNLPAGSVRHYNVSFGVPLPTALNPGDSLGFTAYVLPLGSDLTPNNNIDSSKFVVLSSFDPNGKTMLGEHLLSTQQVINGYDFYYWIGFQNTGNDTAYSVNLYDTLDTQFDYGTFTPIASSHNCFMQVSNQKYLRWQFDNIMLPDSNTNEPESHGYVIFKIKALSNLSSGSVIPNKAGIVFDFNLPVMTNTDLVYIQDPTFILENENNSQLIVFPNPVQNRLNLLSDHIKEIHIYDLCGREVLNEVMAEAMNKADVSVDFLNTGMYRVKIINSTGESKSAAFVIQKP